MVGTWRALLALWLLALCAAAALARGPAPLPEIRAEQLPAEARKTLALIHAGGPFPYRKDGSVFQNRERRLPPQRFGYYREFTVPTPGSPDRGPRRLVTGGRTEVYWTPDHYRTFQRVREAP